MNLSDLNKKVAEAKDTNDIIPMGFHECVVSSAEFKNTKKGGVMLALVYTLRGEHDGRKHFEYINVENENEVAENIGLAQLKALYKAIGNEDPEETDDLIDIPFYIEIKHVPDDYKEVGGKKAEIKKRISKEEYAAKNGAKKGWK